MRFLDICFACDEKDSPDCYIWRSKDTSTIFINFCRQEDSGSKVSFFLQNEQALINFKNKVQWAYEAFMRKKKGGTNNEP